MFLRYVAVDVFSNVTADRIYLSSMRTFTFMRMVIVFQLDDSTIQNEKRVDLNGTIISLAREYFLSLWKWVELRKFKSVFVHKYIIAY